eukprot:4510924-Prymnesium_polylepis.1
MLAHASAPQGWKGQLHAYRRFATWPHSRCQLVGRSRARGIRVALRALTSVKRDAAHSARSDYQYSRALPVYIFES